MASLVATLAVGTEVTDGQIIDRNSAILSQCMTDLGFTVVEHRAVPDNRDLILAALKELGSKVDILFVTGGLGPTSDDFTRDLISEFVGKPLKFSESAWQHVVKTLKSRGVAAREIQKQQCFFPSDAKIYSNPAGTANAFSVEKAKLKIFALPGPPNEIMAVWNDSLAKEFESLIAVESREKLYIWRCLGRGESDIAELVESIVQKAQLRVGYRAHMPYVEVKVWAKPSDNISTAFEELERVLLPYIVNRNSEDLARDFLAQSSRFKTVEVVDSATYGLLAERLFSSLNSKTETIALTVHSVVGTPQKTSPSANDESLQFILTVDPSAQNWTAELLIGFKVIAKQSFKPIYNHKVDSERGRKYICEKALQFAVSELAKLA